VEEDIDRHLEELAARNEGEEIEVLAENWAAVQVYHRCQPLIVAGAGGAMFLGVSAQEIESACRLLGVRARRSLSDKVQFLAHAVWAAMPRGK
jgi:hypothetical protein